ncbi:hypothetical protein [Catellatospora sp. NPDC049133]|uniref:hypothetical protein n=1 Tax=Catellatospora sp. NPDC049133 TaxID=3155499 RepID=UPI0034087464
MSVHVVLDPSALIAYGELGPHSLAVAELMASVDENLGLVGVPALSVLESYAALDDTGRAALDALFTRTDGAVVVLPLLAEATLDLAHRPDGVTAAHAHVRLAADEHEALVATYHPELFGDLDEDSVLDLGE